MELDVPRIFLKRGIELKGMEIDRFVFSDRKEGKSDISFELINHCSQGNIDPLFFVEMAGPGFSSTRIRPISERFSLYLLQLSLLSCGFCFL